jgi:hypothetical protein
MSQLPEENRTFGRRLRTVTTVIGRVGAGPTITSAPAAMRKISCFVYWILITVPLSSRPEDLASD